MARTKTGDKPSDIRNAVVNEVAAVGSVAVSVNKVAARANLSVGTVYRYCKSKDELLCWVFMQIKRDIHAAMMDAANKHSGAAKRIRAMWFALVEFGFSSPKEFMLAEMMNAAPLKILLESEELAKMRADVATEIQSGIDENVLVDIPVVTISTVLVSPATLLARRVSLGGVIPETSELESVFEIVWRGVSKQPT